MHKDVYRHAEDFDISMILAARMFREIESERKEVHHGLASRAVD